MEKTAAAMATRLPWTLTTEAAPVNAKGLETVAVAYADVDMPDEAGVMLAGQCSPPGHWEAAGGADC